MVTTVWLSLFSLLVDGTTSPSTFHCSSLEPSKACANSNPLCDNGLSVKLVLRHCLLKQRLKISTLAPSGGMHHSQKCWQRHLKVTLVNLPTAGKYWPRRLAVSFSRHFGSEVLLSNIGLKESFVIFSHASTKLILWSELWGVYAVIALQHHWFSPISSNFPRQLHQIASNHQLAST